MRATGKGCRFEFLTPTRLRAPEAHWPAPRPPFHRALVELPGLVNRWSPDRVSLRGPDWKRRWRLRGRGGGDGRLRGSRLNRCAECRFRLLGGVVTRWVEPGVRPTGGRVSRDSRWHRIAGPCPWPG